MKKIAFIRVFALFSLFICPLLGQTQSGPVIWPYYWYGNEEFIFHTIPVGGWNTLGSNSPRSMGMGETLFASLDPSSGYLNPSFLSNLSRPQLALSYRYSENTYKTSFPPDIIPLSEFSGGSNQARRFTRKTHDVDSAGIALPFGNLVFAANYFLFQEFNFPAIKGSPYVWLDRIEQSGEMRGLNFAVAYRLTESFSLGISASYVYGDIDRRQKFAPVYYIFPDGTTTPGQGSSIPPDWIWPMMTETSHLNLTGFYFNLGATFAPNEKWRVGFALRPPFSINLAADVETTYMDAIFRADRSSGDFYVGQPLVATGSVLFKPVDPFTLTADISVWGWSTVSSDYQAAWYYPLDFKSIVKLNLGAEYRIPLPFPVINHLCLRAGYIYDPQPYQQGWNYSRDYLCAGLSLSIGQFEFESAAKIDLSPKQLQRFHTNVLQVGASYRF